MTIFIEENRVAFYVGFKEKMRERVKESIRNKPSLTIQKTIPRKLSGESWSCHKDRVYLEAFFTTKGVQRKAAESLGIGKSTYNDWVQTNLELIKSEAAKTGLKLDLRTERAEA